MSRLAAAATLFLLVLSGCTDHGPTADDPKRKLQDYISQSFAVKGVDDRGRLASYLTGDAKVRLTAWSDEQFLQAFVDSKRQFVKLAFRELKTVSPKEVSITYELIYLDQSKGKDAKVTNKKLAQMVHDDSKGWLIADVRNLKELVEYRNEMSLP